MSAAARAVACLSGRTLRYAELDGGRLRRLGAADFEVDAERALFGDGDPAVLGALADALAQGLGGTQAALLVFAVHPTVTTSFFTPLPLGLAAQDQERQISQEAALLADLAPSQPVRVRSASVRTEAYARLEWFQVVHVADAVHDRLALLADAVGVAGYDLVDTTRGVAALAQGEGLDLMVGAYHGHTEVAVVRDGAFLYGTHGPSVAAPDTAYFALAALQQAGAQATAPDRLLVYGDAATPERLGMAAEFTATEPTPLDAFARAGRRPDGDPTELAAFAPVLGAAA